jgi:DNA polymerase I
VTLLIDSDWLVHSACSACECDIRWDEWINTLHLEQGDVKDFITMRLAYWQELADDPHVVMCFSDYPSFRYDIWPEYKANRIGKRKPLGMRDIRKWVHDEYECRSMAGLEGDDVMGILATNGNYPNPIIVSIDKDMRTVPCSLLAGEAVETVTPLDANRAWMKQTLTGDSSDGYPGLKGVGPVSAEKILGPATSLPEMWTAVVVAYQKAGFTMKDALTNARMARILRHGDYDFNLSTVRLWDPDRDPCMKTNG